MHVRTIKKKKTDLLLLLFFFIFYFLYLSEIHNVIKKLKQTCSTLNFKSCGNFQCNAVKFPNDVR